jgi:hypothetical protein
MDLVVVLFGLPVVKKCVHVVEVYERHIKTFSGVLLWLVYPKIFWNFSKQPLGEVDQGFCLF